MTQSACRFEHANRILQKLDPFARNQIQDMEGTPKETTSSRNGAKR
jgi:hypothetical protein